MIKKVSIAIICWATLALFGCCIDIEENNNIEEVKLDETMEVAGEMNISSLISVEEFKDYYKVNDSEISDEVIENFIFEYNLSKEKIEKSNYLSTLNRIIKRGDEKRLGYNLRPIMGASGIPKKELDEFIYDANWIVIIVYYPSQTEFVGPGENMVIDFKNKKIYSNSKEEDYREADCSAELTDEAIEDIRREFPKCLSDENQGSTRCGYTYEVYIVDAKKNGIKYEKSDGKNYNVSFDAYWKGLYEESFKKKHVPNTEIR